MTRSNVQALVGPEQPADIADTDEPLVPLGIDDEHAGRSDAQADVDAGSSVRVRMTPPEPVPESGPCSSRLTSSRADGAGAARAMPQELVRPRAHGSPR